MGYTDNHYPKEACYPMNKLNGVGNYKAVSMLIFVGVLMCFGAKGLLSYQNSTFKVSYYSKRQTLSGLGVVIREGIWHEPRFLGVDWKGYLYFLDSAYGLEGAIKVFNREGKLAWYWSGIGVSGWGIGGFGPKMAVTKDGYIWISSGKPTLKGLSLLIFRIGNNKVVRDFRRETPAAITKVLTDFKKRVKNIEAWSVINLWGGGTNVVIHVVSYNKNLKGKVFRIVTSSNGQEVKESKIVKPWTVESPYLAPDGTWWIIERDVQVKPKGVGVQIYWSKLWCRKKGENKRGPLFDLNAHGDSRWIKQMGLDRKGDLEMEAVQVDSKGHLYLIWSRWSERPREAKLFVEGKDLWIGQSSFELALTVLDTCGRLVSSIPWTQQLPMAYPDTWVKMHPSGEGYYEVQYKRKYVEVVFHSLADK